MSGFTPKVSSGSAKIVSAAPKMSATRGSIRPAGSGRLRVRRMNLSDSRSM